MPKTLKSFFSIIARSLKGEHHNFTEGPVSEAVILLAIPMILELGLEGVFAIVDIFFVSKLGPSAVASVGLTESIATLVYSVGIGLSVGATAIVARRIGEKNPEAAAHAAAQAMILSFVVSIFLSIIGIIFASDILAAMGAAPDVVENGAIFMQIVIGGSPAIIFLFLINGIFRGAGNAAMAMRSLWLASGINIILCPIFIHTFGLKGAAIATLFGRSSGIAYQCYYLFKGDGNLRVTVKQFWFDLPIVKTISEVAWPASLQYVIGSGSWILMNRFVAETGGTAASAGYQIAFRNFIFFMLPAWGLSNAAATLVGQNLGAKQIDRAEQSVLITTRYSVILMGFFTLIFVGLSPFIMHFFTTDAEVYQYGLDAMRGIGAGFIFYGIGMAMSQALNGAGDSKTPTWMNFFCFWVFQTPLAYYLTKHTSMGAHGTIIAIPLAHALLALMAWIVFKRGSWKTVQI